MENEYSHEDNTERLVAPACTHARQELSFSRYEQYAAVPVTENTAMTDSDYRGSNFLKVVLSILVMSSLVIAGAFLPAGLEVVLVSMLVVIGGGAVVVLARVFVSSSKSIEYDLFLRESARYAANDDYLSAIGSPLVSIRKEYAGHGVQGFYEQEHTISNLG